MFLRRARPPRSAAGTQMTAEDRPLSPPGSAGPSHDPAGRAGAAYASAKPDRTRPLAPYAGRGRAVHAAAGYGVRHEAEWSPSIQLFVTAYAVRGRDVTGRHDGAGSGPPTAYAGSWSLGQRRASPELDRPAGPSRTASTWLRSRVRPRSSTLARAASTPRRPGPVRSPRGQEYPVWERLAPQPLERSATGPLQVVLDSIQVNPAHALARHLRRRPMLWTHSDGLMTYCPDPRHAAAAACAAG